MKTLLQKVSFEVFVYASMPKYKRYFVPIRESWVWVSRFFFSVFVFDCKKRFYFDDIPVFVFYGVVFFIVFDNREEIIVKLGAFVYYVIKSFEGTTNKSSFFFCVGFIDDCTVKEWAMLFYEVFRLRAIGMCGSACKYDIRDDCRCKLFYKGRFFYKRWFKHY